MNIQGSNFRLRTLKLGKLINFTFKQISAKKLHILLEPWYVFSIVNCYCSLEYEELDCPDILRSSWKLKERCT